MLVRAVRILAAHSWNACARICTGPSPPAFLSYMVEFLDLYVTLGLLALLAEQANVPKMHWLKIMSSVFCLALKSLIKIVNDDSEILRVLSERSSFLISHQCNFMRGNLLNDDFFFLLLRPDPCSLALQWKCVPDIGCLPSVFVGLLAPLVYNS